MLKKLGRALATTVVVLIGIALLATVAGVLKIAFYEQQDDPVHLREKRAYLNRIHEAAGASTTRRPNIVFVLYDDLGYGDLSITGSSSIATPNIDALARDGVTLDRFYSPAPICTPSRFGFLTGRFAERAQLSHVVFPENHPITWILKLTGSTIRMPGHEITLAEVLRAAGYRTGMVGKWHLGDHSPSLPNDLGFEAFFGALYSNDMQPFALYRDREIVEPAPAEQTRLSERYAREAEAFIEQHSDRPFFLYLAHNFPHLPLHVRESRRGQSRGGLYGDVVEELDDGIGRIVSGLKAAGVYDNTLIVITSDNGPWFQGSAGPVRARKGETFEGGMRVPLIARWPRLACRDCRLDGLAMGTDLLPTVLDILNLPTPSDRVLDGKSLLPMLTESAPSPHQYLYYFSGELYAVRDDRFKYMPRRRIVYPTAGAAVGIGMEKGPWLFDLGIDPDESYDISDHNEAAFEKLARVYREKAQAMEADRFGALEH